MSNQDSKRYYITLSKEEVAEVEGQAEQQRIPVAHVVRNRYRQQSQSQKHSGAEVDSHSAQSISEQPARSSDNFQKLPTMPEATTEPRMGQLFNQMARVEAQLDALKQEVRQLVEEGIPTQPTIEPQLRAALQPLYARLQQTETRMSEVGKLLVQVVERLEEISQVMGSDRAQSALQFQRLEAFLEVVHLLNERQLIALTPAEMRVQEQDFMNEVHTQLQQYLEGDGRLNR
jgi:chaperonin cofactor prefoldin